MKPFLRSVQFAWQYRGRLIASVAAAGVAAILWSVIFLAVHPCMKLLSGVPSLADSVAVDIENIEKQAESHRAKIDKLNAERDAAPSAAAREELDNRIRQFEWKTRHAQVMVWRLRMLQSFYARCLPNDRFLTLVVLLSAVLAVIAVKGIFEFVQESLVGSVTNLTLYRLRNRFYRNVLHLDMKSFHDAGSHDLTARFTNDSETLAAGLKTLFGKVIAEPLKALACVAIACTVSWQLTLLFLVLVPLGVLVMGRVGRLMKRASKRVLERMSNIFKMLQETFAGMRIIKAFNQEPWARRQFLQATREYYRRAMRVIRIEAIAGPVIEIMGVAGVTLSVLIGAYLVLSGQTDIWGIRLTRYPLDHETLVLLYTLLAAVADPIRKLSSVYTKLQAAAAAAERIFAAIDRKPAMPRNSTATRLAAHEKEISFTDVTFRYEANREVLRGVNLTIPFGQVVAVVGRNGCGKSTLLNLLPRFYDPQEGAVLIDGVDIRSCTLRSLRQQIAIVSQDTVLFDDTIHGNIAFGSRRATREQVEAAARRAFAHEFIERLPQGYDTPTGELGRALSGGEKQRIALARAILRDPRILILDEFTSQIDAESESKIHEALRELKRGRTTLVITHRLHTLEIADRIVVLDHGRIDAVGAHAELLGRSNAYRNLHDAFAKRNAA
jgi:ATP-binding cassette subfamily B protein/subfamily B ATP-binding cassette protein MsbA